MNALLPYVALMGLSAASSAFGMPRPLTVRCAVTTVTPNGREHVEVLVGVQEDGALNAIIDRNLGLMDDNPLEINVTYDGNFSSINLVHEASDTAFSAKSVAAPNHLFSLEAKVPTHENLSFVAVNCRGEGSAQ